MYYSTQDSSFRVTNHRSQISRHPIVEARERLQKAPRGETAKQPPFPGQPWNILGVSWVLLKEWDRAAGFADGKVECPWSGGRGRRMEGRWGWDWV